MIVTKSTLLYPTMYVGQWGLVALCRERSQCCAWFRLLFGGFSTSFHQARPVATLRAINKRAGKIRKHNKVLPGRHCRWRVAQTKTNIDKPTTTKVEGSKEKARKRQSETENSKHDRAKRIQRIWRELYTML